MNKEKYLKLFLRLALSATFLSAVADRFGYWPEKISVWKNWAGFLEFTKLMNPWFPDAMIPTLAYTATGAEILFGICLIIGFKTKLFAILSAILLAIFAISMTFSFGIKAPFDYSVFTATGAALALSMLKVKFLEIDSIRKK